MLNSLLFIIGAMLTYAGLVFSLCSANIMADVILCIGMLILATELYFFVRQVAAYKYGIVIPARVLKCKKNVLASDMNHTVYTLKCALSYNGATLITKARLDLDSGYPPAMGAVVYLRKYNNMYCHNDNSLCAAICNMGVS